MKKVLFLLIPAVVLVCGLSDVNCHAMATEAIGSDKDRGLQTDPQPFWPWRIVAVPRHPARVYSQWCNGSEDFYFNADPNQVNELLALFSRAQTRDHEVVICERKKQVKAFAGDPVDYNVKLHISGCLSMSIANKDKTAETFDPVLTIFADRDSDVVKSLKLPENIILTSDIPDLPVESKLTRPRRQMYHGLITLKDGDWQKIMKSSRRAVITYWQKDVGYGIELCSVDGLGRFSMAFSDDEITSLTSGDCRMTITLGTGFIAAKRDDPVIDIVMLSPDREKARPIMFEMSDFRPRTFTEIIEKHPAPDLTDLAERSSPDVRDQDIATQSFYDLLKLRMIGTPEAIPALEKVVKDHLYSTRIHGFAAAQALFCIGTPNAHKILKEYLLNDHHNSQLGINYTFHWEMPEPQRSALIERYYLANCSSSLEIGLEAQSEMENDIQAITITATLKNISQETYRISDYPFAFGDHLYFQAQDGHFVQRLRMSTRCKWRDEWIELKPGQTKQYQTRMEVASADKLPQSFRRYLKNGNLWLKENHSNAFFIENPGQFKVYAMLEMAPQSKEHIERVGFDNAWVGRAVSKPITIKIGSSTP